MVASTSSSVVPGLSRDVLDRPRHVQEVLADEFLLRINRRVPVRLDAEPLLDDRRVGAQQFVDLARRPQIAGALRGVRPRLIRVFRRHAVRVLGGIEAAHLVGHLAHDVLERVLGHVGKKPIAGGLRRFQQGDHELRLVVEHLLEVRHPPRLVDRVPVKPSAHVIAHPAVRHRAQRHERHAARVVVARPCVFAKEKQQLAGTRKLR